MCGIGGVVGRRIAPEQLTAMLDAQNHRGPDDRGSFQDPALPVALCHNRLSIIDTSPAGHQPMASPDGLVWMVYNGEVYNYRELRQRLPDYPYKGTSDSEVVLAAYLEWGPACVYEFNGMFAIAIWDGRSNTLFCARDRLGIKPLHYSTADGAFSFSSEVKGLRAVGVGAGPDMSTWAAYLVHGHTDHTEATFFEGVRVLPAGCTLEVSLDRPGDIRLKRYWDLPALTQEFAEISDEEAAETLTTLLDDSVRLRLRSDVPLGVNLSGGLDSASLMAAVDLQSDDVGEIQTFTASFADSAYDEVDSANEVPRRNAWIRHWRRLDHGHVMELAKRVVQHQESPFGGVATLAYHHLHGLALEKGVTVLLEGQGVDELLAGYRYVLPHHLLDLEAAGKKEDVERELMAQGSSAVSLLAEMDRIKKGTERNVYQDGTSHLRPACIHPDIRDLAGPAPTFPEPYSDRLRNVLYRDLVHTKLSRVLRMNDRISMAFSRELREPFLDHRIVEFAFVLPGHLKIRNGASKFILRRAMVDRLPESVRFVPKRSVVTPQREWLQGKLAPEVQSLIDSSEFAARGLFLPDAVGRAFDEFKAASGENAFYVWQWVNTELWFRQFAI